jgi:hypothetical protein
VNATAIRRELKRYIDAIPESNLEIVRPMLSYLAGNQTQNEPLVIETNLTKEEKAIVKAGRKERKEHPENFTPWSAIKAETVKKTGKTNRKRAT